MSAARSPVTPPSPAATATPPPPSAPPPSASASSASAAGKPLPLQDRAFLLYCEGLRSPAIAEQLHVPERTIRAWIADALDDSFEVRRLLRHEALERAVARLQATAQAAWDAFERVADADGRALDSFLLVSPTNRAVAPPPSLSPLGPRYLAVALAAERELARLLHLADLTHEDETSLAHAAQTIIAADTATAAEAAEAAAGAAALARQLARAAERRAGQQLSAGARSEIPAETATPPPPAPSRSAPASTIAQSTLPAKTATPSPPGTPYGGAAVSALKLPNVPAHVSADDVARMAAALDRQPAPILPHRMPSGG